MSFCNICVDEFKSKIVLEMYNYKQHSYTAVLRHYDGTQIHRGGIKCFIHMYKIYTLPHIVAHIFVFVCHTIYNKILPSYSHSGSTMSVEVLHKTKN